MTSARSPFRRLAAVALPLALSLIAAACAHTPPAPAKPIEATAAKPEPAAQAKTEAAALPAPAALESFAMSSRMTPRYGEARPEWPAAQGIELRLEETARAPFAAQPQSDAVLRQAARELARFFALSQQRPSDSFLRFALGWVGSYDVAPYHFLFGQKEAEPQAALLGSLAAFCKDLNKRGITHLGVGTYRQGEGPLYVALVAVARPLTLAPIDKRLSAEHRFILSGTAPKEAKELGVYLDFMGERVFDSPLAVKDGRFLTEVQVPSAPARYELELTMNEAQGQRVAASLTLYGELEPPAQYDAEKPEPKSLAPEALAERLETLINTQRAQIGQPALVADTTLREEAKSHAADMLKQHYLAIVDRQGQSAEARLRARKLEPLASGEFVDSAYTPQTLESHLLASPSLKNYITTAHLTHVGCGVGERRRAGAEGGRYLVTSCLLATLPEPGTDADLERAVGERLDALRQKAGYAAFKRNPALAPIVTHALTDLLAHPEDGARVQGEVAVALERSGEVRKNGVYGVFTFYGLTQLDGKSLINQLVQSPTDTLVLAVRKELSPQAARRGIFVYYLAYLSSPAPAPTPELAEP